MNIDLGAEFVNPAYISRGMRKTVFKAFHTKSNRWVAVKLVKVENSVVFLDELAPSLRSLEHKNIIEVIDIGQIKYRDSKVPYIIEELLDYTMDRYVPIRPRSLLIEQLFGITSGLAYLHSQQLVHRDLKPDNCGVSRGTVKLFDFGTVSSAVEASLKYGHPGTRSSEILSRGLAKAPTREHWNFAQDVWALGCSAYFFSFGEYPFMTLSEVRRLGETEDILYRGLEGNHELARRDQRSIIIKARKRMRGWRPENDPRLKMVPELKTYFSRVFVSSPEERSGADELKGILKKIVRGQIAV